MDAKERYEALKKLVPNAEDRENLGHILNDEVIKHSLVTQLAYLRGEIPEGVMKHRKAYAETIRQVAHQLGFSSI